MTKIDFSQTGVWDSQFGFALPTILISSVVMIIALLAGVTTSVSVSNAINAQYYNDLANEAGDAGLVMAKACIAKDGSAKWTNAKPLKPNTDCNGDIVTPAISSFVLNTSPVRTFFSVPAPTVEGTNIYLKTLGTVERLRTSNQAAWKTYSNDAHLIIKTAATASMTPQAVTSIKVGQNVLCGVTASYSLYCLGNNTNYPLGTGDNGWYVNSTFKQLNGDLTGKNVDDFSVNSVHGCAIADNKVYCWGTQQNGATGTNNPGATLSPTAVVATGALSGKTMTTVAAMGTEALAFGIALYAHTCALDNTGAAYCWGANGNGLTGGGQLGNGVVGGGDSSVPAAVVGGLKFKQDQISGGSWHTCAIATNSKLYCWGADNNGQIGNGGGVTHTGTPSAVQGNTFLDIEFLSQNFTQISSGNAHSCAVSTEHKLWCWGQNAQGQLGVNSTTGSQFARKVANPPAGENGWQAVSAGTYWTCALTVAEHVYCWGGNGFAGGQSPWIGDGKTTGGLNRKTPVAVKTDGVLSGKRLIGLWTGKATTTVKDDVGKYYSWGVNSNGMLGTGLANNAVFSTYVPIESTYLNSFTTINSPISDIIF